MWSKKLRFPESIKSPTTGDITTIMHGVVFNRKGNLSRFRKFNVQAHILSLKYKLLAAKGSVSDCNMTRACSIFASLAFQLFLSRQVHTAQEYLSNSNPADQGTEANTCSSVFGLWGRYFPQYVDLARTPALSESKTSSHNTRIPQFFQPSSNQRQTLACLFLDFDLDTSLNTEIVAYSLDPFASHNVICDAPTRVEEKGAWYLCFSYYFLQTMCEEELQQKYQNFSE